MKKKWIFGIIAVVIIAAVAVSVVTGKGPLGIFKSNGKGEIVKTAIVKLNDVNAYLSTTAVIKSKYKNEYYSQQAKIVKVNVSVGDKVKDGQVLIVYEKQDTATQVRLAQIQYDNVVLSRTELRNQNNDIIKQIKDLERQIKDLELSTDPTAQAKITSLKQQKASLKPISAQKLKQADNAIESARLSLNSAKSSNSKNKNQTISKSDGVVTELNAVEGAMGSGAQIAVVVQDLTSLKAVVTLGKFDASKVQIGQPAKISIGKSASTNIIKTVSGTVSFIDPAAKLSPTGDATLGVEVDILEQTDALKIDFTADIDILTASATAAISIPSECIRYEKGGRSLVYVVKDGVIEIREAQLGVVSETYTQILKGAIVGEKVVLNPTTVLVNGTQVVEK